MPTPTDRARWDRLQVLRCMVNALWRKARRTADPQERKEIRRRAGQFYQRWWSLRRAPAMLPRGLLKTACQVCGTNEDLHGHHINGNRWDTGARNIGTLCGDCHEWIHSLYRPPRAWGRADRRRVWRRLLKDAAAGKVRAGYSLPASVLRPRHVGTSEQRPW